MRTRWRFIFVPVVAVALMFLALPGAADHATRSDVRNIEAVADLPTTDTFANTDMAFWGDHAFQGQWEGFRILNISNPTSPTVVLDYDGCNDPAAGIGGGQSDLIIWENLLVRSWNSDAQPGAFCGTDANGNPMPVPTGFEGIHIFNIANLTNPQLVASLEIDTDAPGKPAGLTHGCGSHTLTAVPDPANNNLYVYVGGSSQTATANCNGMDLVKIPLNDPAAADWYGRAEATPTGAVFGRSCHDITVYLIHKLRAVCSGSWTSVDNPAPTPDVTHHGYAYFSMDAADGGSLEQPELLYQQDVPATTTVGHTSSFSWDGKILGWSHEPGGGVQAQCESTDPITNRQMFFFAAETGSMKGVFTIPTQSADESCASVHIMQSIPTTNGHDVYSSGTYMANTYIIDYTDPTDPSALGWSDGPPDQSPAPPGIILGGAWATYWYNGFLYESNIKKGLFISRSTSPEAQTPIKLDFLNPQTFMPLPQVAAAVCKGKPANLVGTAAKDSIVGTGANDVIAGLAGNDRINGKGGKDTVCAGGGKDKVRGKGGRDKLFGQAQNDRLNGGGGRDRCVGGGGKDKATKCEKVKSL